MKIAALQMCSSAIIDENLAMARKLIGDAAHNQAKLIILPEMFAIIGQKDTDKIIAKEIFGAGKIQSFLSEQSKKNRVWIVGGTIPIACEAPGKVKAACLVYDDNGVVVARYDKAHLFDVTLSATESYRESNTTKAGNDLVVIDTPVGKLGLAVCYDLRFPEIFRCLANRGAEVIAVPAAFTTKTGQAHWELLIRARAIDNFCYLIGAAEGGAHANGRQTYGNSVIVDPWGTIIAKKEDMNPGVIYSDIDLKYLREIRSSIPIFDHQRIRLADTKLAP